MKDELKKELTEGFKDVLESLVEGGEEDLRAFAEEISNDLVLMIESGDIDLALSDEWSEQLLLIAEANRIRASAAVTAQIQKVAIMAVRMAIAAA